MAGRKVWKASDYLRVDWTPEDVTALLESRARGYNGQLREILCTAAAMLRNVTGVLEVVETPSGLAIQPRAVTDAEIEADDKARNRVDMPRDGS